MYCCQLLTWTSSGSHASSSWPKYAFTQLHSAFCRVLSSTHKQASQCDVTITTSANFHSLITLQSD